MCRRLLTLWRAMASGFHQFADDMQLYVAITSTNADLDRLQRCSDDVQAWYLQNDLLLNPDKSEVLVFGTSSSLRSVLNSLQ